MRSMIGMGNLSWGILVLVLSATSLSYGHGVQDTSSSSSSNDPEEAAKRKVKDTSVNDIAFDLPDITVPLRTAQGQYHLEAFKSVDNDGILNQAGVPRASQLIWVSVGQPTLVRTPSILRPTQKKLFHLTHYGFYVHFDLLTDAQRRILAATAARKYNVKLIPSQIVSLVLSMFDCTFTLYDDSFKKYLIKGTVADFRTFPLRMDFLAPPKSTERRLLSELLAAVPENALDVRFMCSMSSCGKRVLTNTLSITSVQSERIGLAEKLFGPSAEGEKTVYVSRDQVAELSREMYSTLNIVEDYEMPESQFSEVFVNDFIRQTADPAFSFVPIDEVLKTLSTYTLDFSEDLKPDIIEKDLGSILKVDEVNKKSRIVTDESYLKETSSGSSSRGKRKVRGWFSKRSIRYGKSNSQSSKTQTRSLNDQMNELNDFSKDEIKWNFEGKKVVPKSLNVARLVRAKFDKTLNFHRVRIQKEDAPFVRQFMVYTHRSISADVAQDDLRKELAKLSSQMRAVNETNAELAKKTSALQSQVVSVSRTALRSCRICFKYSGSSSLLYGNTPTCSGWSSSPAWTSIHRLYTGYHSYAYYYWNIECRAISY